MRLKSRTLGTALIVLPVILSGCGGDLSPVNGTVKIGDEPLTTGNIAFHPVGGGPVGYGTIQSDGSFTVRTGTRKGLAPGDYRVAIVATGDMPEPTPEDPEPLPELLIPARYGSPETSGQQYTVGASGGRLDIVLQRE